MHSLFDISATSPENARGTSSETGFALENVQLELESSDHRSQITQLATDLSVIPPFNQRLFLEYESVVREVVVAGNRVEASAAAAAYECECGQPRRQKRNQQGLKAGFCRHLNLEPDRKKWLVKRAFKE
jgi:hypothetical protein